MEAKKYFRVTINFNKKELSSTITWNKKHSSWSVVPISNITEKQGFEAAAFEGL